MTVVNERNFLERLLEVVAKLASIAKTQSYRFQKIWDNYFANLQTKPHIVRQIPLDKEKFLEDNEYRLKVLNTTVNSVADGYYSIQSILKALYSEYFQDSELMNKDFSEEDQIILKYLAAREILGNLVQYNKMDHETVPLKYTIIAREYLMIKLKGITLENILVSLKKLNIDAEKPELIDIMAEVEKDGIINIEKTDNSYRYTLQKELVLSEEGTKTYNSTLRPLVDWPTQFWRSYYNVRELNFTTSGVPLSDFLNKILSKAATQGFGPTHYVFKNLVKYFEQKSESTG